MGVLRTIKLSSLRIVPGDIRWDQGRVYPDGQRFATADAV